MQGCLGDSLAEFTVDSIELPPGEKAVLSVQLIFAAIRRASSAHEEFQ
jgi:hypothetical protein